MTPKSLVLNLLLSAMFTSPVHAEQSFANLAYTRVTMDDKDRSYFAESVMPFNIKEFAPPSGPIGVSKDSTAKSIVFYHCR